MKHATALFLLCTTASIVGTSATAFARSPQRPVRDIRVEPTGTGVISGVITDATEAKKPLRRAAVTISSEALLTARQLYTRDDGTFMFDGLPPGKYVVSASRAAFMTEQYGATRPGGTGSAIVLANSQVINIALRLSRFASITGVIYDQDGEPASNVSVEALKYTMRTGRRALSSVYGRPSTTDDRGVYELVGLAPGEYFVAAGPSPDRGPADVQQLTAADVDRVLQAVNAPTPPAIIDARFTQPHQSYAPVYFPGSPDFSRAQPIVLVIGEQRSNVDIRLQLVRASRIDGTLTAPDGRPAAGVRVNAIALTEATTLDLFSPGAITSPTTDSQGRFSFPAVAPARYAITARAAAGQIGADNAALGPLWVATEIGIGGTDETLTLTLQPGVNVSGRVAFAGTSIPAPAPITGVRVGLTNLRTFQSPFYSDPLSVPPVIVNPDGTFTMTGAPPGSYRLSSAPPVSPPGWALRSAMLNGVDLLDVPLTLTTGQPIDTIVVTFTDRPTELAGTLQTTAGTPTADYFIIVFAKDRAFWTTSSRRNVMARPDSAGKFTIKNLPPGEYLVVAVTDVQLGDWWDPAFLERLSPLGQPITLAEGEKKSIDLRIGGY